MALTLFTGRILLLELMIAEDLKMWTNADQTLKEGSPSKMK